MLFAVIKFYHDGFRSMRLGRTLWKIILVKLFVLFAVLKVFLFPNPLQTGFSNDQNRAEHVLTNLTMRGSCVSGAFGDETVSGKQNPRTEVLRD